MKLPSFMKTQFKDHFLFLLTHLWPTFPRPISMDSQEQGPLASEGDLLLEGWVQLTRTMCFYWLEKQHIWKKQTKFKSPIIQYFK